ncbi:TPA: hypothetical protein DDW35_09585, partial [Candidatus Sumerlaeota bacterium]|nr:hypothetical protein [Candidatus Sumerlaeota bacterium]
MGFNKALRYLLLGLLLLSTNIVCAQEHSTKKNAAKPIATQAVAVPVATQPAAALTSSSLPEKTPAGAEALFEFAKQAVDNVALDDATTGTQRAGAKARTTTKPLGRLHYYGVYAGIFMAFLLLALFIRSFCQKLSQKHAALPSRALADQLLSFYWPIFVVGVGLHFCLSAVFPRIFNETINNVAKFVDLFLLGLAILRPLDILGFDYYCVEKNHWRVPRLIRDVIRAPLYVFAVIFAYTTAFGGNFSGIFATSAVLSFILGFALQDTLANLFAGLAIHIEGSFGIGDWVEVGTREGEVASVTWRAIKVRTATDDYISIPNSAVAKGEIINHSQPTPTTRQQLEFNLSVSLPPNRVQRVLLEIADGVEEICKTPAPSVRLLAFNDASVKYGLLYYIEKFGYKGLVQHKINELIWYNFKREGISISAPGTPTYIMQAQAPPPSESTSNKTPRLAQIYFLRSLDPLDLEKLASALTTHLYAPGEIILRQDIENDQFFLLEQGMVAVEHEIAGKPPVHLANLQSGDFFGEHSLLTGDKTTATIRAIAP